jgi:hypothetical protein
MEPYVPRDVRNILHTFVEVWFSPHGRGNPEGVWNVVPSCNILSFLFSAQGIEHELVSGQCNGEQHYWLVSDGAVFDPSRKKFGDLDKIKLEYEKHKEFPVMPLLHYMRTIPLQNFGPVIEEYTASFGRDGVLNVAVFPDGDKVPGFEFSVLDGKKFVNVLHDLVTVGETP